MENIDILQAYDQLRESGVSKDQAKAQLNILDGVLNNLDTKLENFATKDDLKHLENSLTIKFIGTGLLVIIVPFAMKYFGLS